MARTCGEPNEIKKNTDSINITALVQDTYPVLRGCVDVAEVDEGKGPARRGEEAEEDEGKTELPGLGRGGANGEETSRVR